MWGYGMLEVQLCAFFSLYGYSDSSICLVTKTENQAHHHHHHPLPPSPNYEGVCQTRRRTEHFSPPGGSHRVSSVLIGRRTSEIITAPSQTPTTSYVHTHSPTAASRPQYIYMYTDIDLQVRGSLGKPRAVQRCADKMWQTYSDQRTCTWKWKAKLVRTGHVTVWNFQLVKWCRMYSQMFKFAMCYVI